MPPPGAYTWARRSAFLSAPIQLQRVDMSARTDSNGDSNAAKHRADADRGGTQDREPWPTDQRAGQN
jgi:hypothetical protein